MGLEKHWERYKKRAAKEERLALRKKIRTAAMSTPVPNARPKLPPRRRATSVESLQRADVKDKWTMCPKCQLHQLAVYRGQHVCKCGYTAPVKGEVLNRPGVVGGYGTRTGG